jgi:hypothetical protein
VLKIACAYSRKEGSEWASCTVDGVELDPAVLDDPIAFRDRVRAAYERCVDVVDVQLGGPAPVAPRKPATPAAPARPARPARPTNNHDAPPRSGHGLWAFAKDHDCVDWLLSMGKTNDWPARIVHWDDEQVALAYQGWCDQAGAETDHEATVRRQGEKRAERSETSRSYSRNGR